MLLCVSIGNTDVGVEEVDVDVQCPTRSVA
jgi:hypothetical protein